MSVPRGLLGALLLTLAASALAGPWRVDPGQSRLGFTATWQGAPFQGVFRRWKADLQFDPARLDQGSFDVRIDVTSVDTQSEDRDQAMGGPEWLDFAHFPEARFVSTRFEAPGGEGFLAWGRLTIKGVSRDIAVPFQWHPQGTRARLRVDTRLKRADFNLGEGEWSSGDDIGLDVQVQADLVLTQGP